MIIILPFFISACGVTGTPECNDDYVTSLVKEITLNTIKDDYARYYSPYAGEMKYQALKEAVANGSDFLAEHLVDVEKDAGEAQISLSGIRIQTMKLKSQNAVAN